MSGLVFVSVMRGGRLISAVRACWKKNLDISSYKVLKRVIAETQFDANHIMDRVNSEDIKKALRALTQEAKDVGLCGVPSYRVFRRMTGASEWNQVGDLVWGQDELAVVEDMIVGCNGDELATVEGGGAVERSRL